MQKERIKKFKIKEEKGITLVALIITIIILLILAGITIATLSSSGLFNKSKKAADISKREAIIEAIKLDIMAAQANNTTPGIISDIDLEGILDKYGKVQKDAEEKVTGVDINVSEADEAKKSIIKGFEGIIDLKEIYAGSTVSGGEITAKDVQFEPTDENWKVTTVEAALDYLYDHQ